MATRYVYQRQLAVVEGECPHPLIAIEEDIDLEKLKSISKELHLEILKQISEDFRAEISKSIYKMERSLEILDDVEVKERLLSNANPIPVGGKSGTTLSQIHNISRHNNLNNINNILNK